MNQENRWRLKFENFEKAFESLTEAMDRIKKSPKDDLLRAGFIQTYEFSLELSWKTLHDYLEEQGFPDLSSPKKVLRTAFKEGYIKEGELWLKAIDDRNLTVHTYNEKLAEEVKNDILEKYYPIIRDLYHTLKKE